MILFCILAHIVIAQLAGYCRDKVYCLYGGQRDAQTVFTIHSSALGWAAFGVGDQMVASPLFIGFQNSTSGFTVISAVADEYARPTPVKEPNFSISALQVPKPNWANIAFSIQILNSVTTVPITANSNFIYAFSNTKPANVDSVSTSYKMHDDVGQITGVDFTKILPDGNAPAATLSSTIASPSLTPSVPPARTPVSVNDASFCDGTKFCVFAKVQGSNIVFTVHSSALGWVAFGVGSSMQGAVMYVGWKNSAGNIMPISASSSGHAMPSPTSPNQIQPMKLQIAKPVWANLAFSFSRPVGGVIAIDANTNYIYAYSEKAPTNIDSSNAKYGIHSKFGFVNEVDFTKSGTSTATSNAVERSISAASSSSKDASFCEDRKYCVYGQVEGSDIFFTIHSAASGWAAFGIGTSMTGSTMYIGWKNSSGNVLPISASSSGHSMPPATSPNQLQSTPLKIAKPSWANLAFSFSRPVGGSNAIGAKSSYIYAYSDTPPTNVDSPSAQYSIHSKFGFINNVDFTKAGSSDSSSDKAVGDIVVSSSNGTTDGPASFCDAEETFCVYGGPKDGGLTVFTVHAAASGWVAVGLGESMAAASIYTGWKNSTSGFMVVSTVGQGHVQPSERAVQDITILPVAIPAPPWAKIAYSFSRPTKADTEITKSSTYIYAYSNNAPTGSIDSVSAKYTIHSKFGIIKNVDFTSVKGGSTGGNVSGGGFKPFFELPTGLSWKMVLNAHGVIMLIAWGIAPFVGIFIARYLKHLGHIWYQLHVFIFVVLTGFGSIVGMLLVFLFISSSHFASWHAVSRINTDNWIMLFDRNAISNRPWVCH